MSKEIIIIGAGGQARSITESVISNGFRIKYYVDKYKSSENLFGYTIKKKLLIDKNNKVNILIAIADNYKREKIYKSIIEKYKNYENINLIGMGGSILGTEAIYDFLKFKIKKKIKFFNNLNNQIKIKEKKL